MASLTMPRKGQLKKSASRRSKLQRRYNSSKLQLKRRAMRNKARRKAIKAGRVKRGDGKDVDHVFRRSLRGRTRVQSVKRNRGRNKPLWRKGRRKRRLKMFKG